MLGQKKKHHADEDIDNTPDNSNPYIKFFFRAFSIILVIYIELSLFAPLPKSGQEIEVIIDINSEKYVSTSGRRGTSHSGKTVTIETNFANVYSFDTKNGAPFQIQDTIITCKDMFGKKVGAIHHPSNLYYRFDKLQGLLFLLTIITIIYALFNLFGDYRVRIAFIGITVLTLSLLILYWTS